MTDVTVPQSTYQLLRRPEVLAHVPDRCRSFLDVGCARGGFGLALREHFGADTRLVGIEAVPEQATEARQAFDHVIDGYYPDVTSELRGETFDCVSMLDVLEHMVDPWSAVAATRPILKPGGCIVASIPNIQYLPVWWQVLRGRWEYTAEGTLDRTHLRFFTRDSMVSMFEDAGYRVRSIEGVSSWIQRRKKHLPARLAQQALGDTRWLQFVIVAELPAPELT